MTGPSTTITTITGSASKGDQHVLLQATEQGGQITLFVNHERLPGKLALIISDLDQILKAEERARRRQEAYAP